MEQVRLTNFRKYDILEELNLNDINIFVGKNNAGKSTVVKAIMLALDNIRSLRWRNVPQEEGMCSMKYAPVPLFRFDANGFHNLHIGTFERARCNFVDDKRISIAIEYQGFVFDITVAGVAEGAQVAMPMEKLKVTVPGHSIFEFDFAKMTMRFSLGEKLANDDADEQHKAIWWCQSELAQLEEDLQDALANGDALSIAEIQQKITKQKTHIAQLEKMLPALEKKRTSSHATFDLSYFHAYAGENILAQYLRTFTKIADTQVVKQTGIGNVLTPASRLNKNSKEYKEELQKRQFVAENRKLIEDVADKLEQVVNNVNVDYIQAHAATQKLILNADDRQDVNSRVVHEFYQEHILEGELVDQWLKKWLRNFEVGERIMIMPLDGEGYYVKVDTPDDEVHLADMGMGSIQLVILLLRLATIANRIKNTGQPWWVIIEEPEQNMHPMLQSKLADLFVDFQQAFASKIIVETHSEYLVRRTQLMVAERNYDEEDLALSWPVTVFYFPSERGCQPYDMEYQTNGLFAKKFDSGFFDEAGRMHMEILKNSKKGR